MKENRRDAETRREKSSKFKNKKMKPLRLCVTCMDALMSQVHGYTRATSAVQIF
jgi:hypothetical protein